MAAPTVNAQGATAFTGVAADAHSLDQLHLLATRDPAKAVHQVATQFEALFLQTVLKSMREATLKSGLFNSSEEETYTGMLDQQIAQKVAAGGTGLADVIARQLSLNLPSSPAAGPAATAPPTAPPTAAPRAAAQAPAGAAAAAAPGTVRAGAAGPATAAAPASSPGRMLQTLQAAAAARSGR